MGNTITRRLRGPLAVLAGGAAVLGFAATAGASPDTTGAVFVEGNAANGNVIHSYTRSSQGTLTPSGLTATGGLGTGAGLGSQGALALQDDVLVAVNAGSDDLSVFRAGRRGLTRTDLEPSGGDQPISVTVHDGLVYALNAGGSGNLSGFRLTRDGRLVPIPGSTRALSTSASGPAQVAFSPDGDRVVVTEKAADVIDSYPVARDGRLGAAVVTRSSGATPFGFDFDRRGRIFVSEAFGGAAGQSAVSSYDPGRSGALRLLSGSVPTLQTAACWVAVSGSGRYAYAANTGSNSITGYAISPGGTISRLAADGVSARTGAVATDLAFSRGSRFLFSRGAGDGSISGFALQRDGALAPVGVVQGLPSSAVGLAAE